MEDEVIDSTVEGENISEVTMDDTIRKTLEDIESRDDSRDENGRFTSKEQTPATEPKPEESEPVAEEAPAEPIPEPAIPTELQRLGLRKEAASAIAKDPVVMQEFIRRSDEMHRKALGCVKNQAFSTSAARPLPIKPPASSMLSA